jgi:carboxymethylenebutenolidase
VRDAIRAGTITITADGGDEIEAYLAEPVEGPPGGGVILNHHAPGFDAGTKEFARRFATWGYTAIVPNLNHRIAPGAPPDDASAAARAQGGKNDAEYVRDVTGAVDYLRSLATTNGKVGVIGHCSGGRQAVLAACSVDLDAAVDCYGAFVVGSAPEGFPLRMTSLEPLLPRLSCPLLGLFGNDDSHPSPDQVAELDKQLTEHGKEHEFHSYDGAGHAFFSVERPSYRSDAAADGWERIRDFFGRHLH